MPNLHYFGPELPVAILDILPDPVLIKDAETRYIWVNAAFENLFTVKREDLVGRLDAELFPGRQVAQCNGGDLRVLETGRIDEAYETVFEKSGAKVETITRKNRLVLKDGTKLLVGIMHDVTAITRANAQLEQISYELEEKAQQLQSLAETDPLTQCFNRRALFERSRLLGSASYGLAIFDLDHFKTVNDTYGHDAGDETLVSFAQTVRSLLSEHDMFARLGGEEFVLLLPGSSEARLRDLTEKVRATWSETVVETVDTTIRSTVSVGAVYCPTQSDKDFRSYMAAADQLLYEAKSEGRNQVKLSGSLPKEAA